MKKLQTNLHGVYVIELDVHSDERGFFIERFNKIELAKLGINDLFVQDNHSRSKYGVTRGLHMQHGQSKLIGVSYGRIFDVAVDARLDSMTFGQYFSIELSYSKLLWVPSGFLHGFQVISEFADVIYKVTDFYVPQKELVVQWNDAGLGIDWPLQDATVSKRDSVGMTFTSLTNDLKKK